MTHDGESSIQPIYCGLHPEQRRGSFGRCEPRECESERNSCQEVRAVRDRPHLGRPHLNLVAQLEVGNAFRRRGECASRTREVEMGVGDPGIKQTVQRR